MRTHGQVERGGIKKVQNWPRGLYDHGCFPLRLILSRARLLGCSLQIAFAGRPFPPSRFSTRAWPKSTASAQSYSLPRVAWFEVQGLLLSVYEDARENNLKVDGKSLAP